MALRRDSAIHLSEDVVDANGLALFIPESGSSLPANDDSTIAPWLDEPPTPPPKSPPARPFPKNSFSSFMGRNKPYTTDAGPSVLSLVSSSKRRSADNNDRTHSHSHNDIENDDDSSHRTGNGWPRGTSTASTHSSELRNKQKSTFQFLGKLRGKSSRPHLRTDSDETQHPSLKPTIPPLPPLPTLQRGLIGSASTATLLSVPSTSTNLFNRNGKGRKGKSKDGHPPDVPPKIERILPVQVTGGTDLGDMNGIIDMSLVGSGSLDASAFPYTGPSSPSHSSQSASDHGSTYGMSVGQQAPPVVFGNPFSLSVASPSTSSVATATLSTGANGKRVAYQSRPSLVDPRKVSTSASVRSGPGGATLAVPTDPLLDLNKVWLAPESWAVEKERDESFSAEGVGAEQDGASESDSEAVVPPVDRKRSTRSEIRMGSMSEISGPNSGVNKPLPTFGLIAPPDHAYCLKIFRPNQTYHVVSLKTSSRVVDVNSWMAKKNTGIDATQWSLYLIELGRERLLAPTECPAAILKMRMEQAGYDFEDSEHLLPPESLNMLVRFHWKSQLLAGGEDLQMENYDFVNLTNRGLRTIPVILHQHADSIITLRLSRNPMSEIPLDFIQSCTTLRELRLDNMAMKKVPSSIQHSQTLHRLDLSSNSLKDLNDTYLDQIPGLLSLSLHINKLSSLPWHFPRLRSLVNLNLAHNRFKELPQEVTQLEGLHDLDISFNTLSFLPKEIGNLKSLERLIVANNKIQRFPPEVCQLVKLIHLDCRRNLIVDLSPVCRLPALQTINAERNAVRALDLAMGAAVTSLDASWNDITLLSISPMATGPMGLSNGHINPMNGIGPKPTWGLTCLTLSYAKLSSIDDSALRQLPTLRSLCLDHNSLRSLPESLGELRWLEALSVTDNKLDSLPASIGNLGSLETLDAHNNSLVEIPEGIWNCGSLMRVNVTSNCLETWKDPPEDMDATLRKGSAISLGTGGRRISAPLINSLRKLYIGENALTDASILPLMYFRKLEVLNLSFNDIQDLPPGFLRNMTGLEELYLSGNKLTSVPSEDLPRLTKLSTLFLNGNKLQTLPQELGKLSNLAVLDVGSNLLRYNINNWEYEWNWNFNKDLKYLNLSGNKRLQIRAEPARSSSGHRQSLVMPMLPGFTNLTQLRVLGLMDVTMTSTSNDTQVDIPDENLDRRVRTSLSTVCGMGYGIADSLGSNDTLTMMDLVHEFQGRREEAVFAMFGRAFPPRLPHGVSPNRLSRFLHDQFVTTFQKEKGYVRDRRGGLQKEKEGIAKALHWTFLRLNQDLYDSLKGSQRKGSVGSLGPGSDSMYMRMGVSGIVVYFVEKTMHVANVGDALCVVSRQGVAHLLSKRHDPFDPSEAARVRATEGSVSSAGLVNDQVNVSRGFGYFNHYPTINAKPYVDHYDLSEFDEFVIVANSGLWELVPEQTAVDIARSVMRVERADPMLAAQKLRDFAISYGAHGSVMIMVIAVKDLFRVRGGVSDGDEFSRSAAAVTRRGKDEALDVKLKRLDDEVPAPTGHVTIVFTDIVNSTHLWEVNPGMRAARDLHNDLLRRLLRKCGGYEVKTEGDAFMCSFPTVLAAIWWSLEVQTQLLVADWPMEIVECDDGKPRDDTNGRLIACGLSVRMGIHCGTPICERDPITRRMDYLGPMVNRSSRISSVAVGGQIMCSLDVIREINAKIFETEEETEYSKFQPPAAIEGIRMLGVEILAAGEFKLKGIEHSEILNSIYPRGLEGRHSLKEPSASPGLSTSRVKFSVTQMKELGLLCLRIEALSTGRVFKHENLRRAEDGVEVEVEVGAEGEDEDRGTSAVFYGNPDLLLPPITNASSDADLSAVLDSLSLRICNAICVLHRRFVGDGVVDGNGPDKDYIHVDDLMKALLDGGADDSLLARVEGILRRV